MGLELLRNRPAGLPKGVAEGWNSAIIFITGPAEVVELVDTLS